MASGSLVVLCNKLMLPGRLVMFFFFPTGRRDGVVNACLERGAIRSAAPATPLFRRCSPTKPVFIAHPPNVTRSRALASFTNLCAHVTPNLFFFCISLVVGDVYLASGYRAIRSALRPAKVDNYFHGT